MSQLGGGLPYYYYNITITIMNESDSGLDTHTHTIIKLFYQINKKVNSPVCHLGRYAVSRNNIMCMSFLRRIFQ